jgi:L-asparaginase II
MARFGDPSMFDAERRSAVERIHAAVTAHPYLVAGKERLCTVLMELLAPDILVKVGAAGVYTAVIPQHGLGVALKMDDGHDGAARVALGAVLNNLGVLPSDKAQALAEYFLPSLNNSRGETIGRYEPSSAWQDPGT